MSAVALVSVTSLDLGKFLKIGRQALDRNLAESPDSRNLNPPLHHLLCIAAIKDSDLQPVAESAIPYLHLCSAGFMIAADERDFAQILEVGSMPCVLEETLTRGLSIGYMYGTMLQWKQAVLRGCHKTATEQVREVYNKVYGEFKTIGMASVFEARQKQTPTGTFYLEYHK